MKKTLLTLILLTTFTGALWAMAEIPREPYREVSENIELFASLKYKMREQIKKHEEKIAQTRELRNAIPDRQYKEIIEKRQQAINELERFANRDVQFYYDYAFKLPRQERSEGYSNSQFSEFLKQKIAEPDQY